VAHVPSVLGRQLVIERGEGSFIVTADDGDSSTAPLGCGTPISVTAGPN
jgi:hypothetical protein